MSHALMAICGASLVAYLYDKTDFRIGLFFICVLSGFASILLTVNGL